MRDDDLYGRAQADAAFLQRVRDAHGGRWEALDALWWESHPLEVSPSGIPAPAAELRELQRRLFSQSGDAGGDEATTATMRELEATIARERAAIKDAVERAQESESLRPPSHADAEVTRLFDREAGEAAEVAGAEPAPVLGTPSVRRNLAVVLSIAAALVGGLVLGAQLPGALTDAMPPVMSPAPANTASPVVELEVGALAPISVFAGPQQTTDLPAIPLPSTFDPASFRMLGAVGISATETIEAFYAARTTSDLVCLIRVGATPTDYVSACTSEAAFPATGLRLDWHGIDIGASKLDEGVMVEGDRYAIWHPDTSVEWGSTPR